jgi:sigma-B regulation protein RsbU (phosphoserine phosphatase)
MAALAVAFAVSLLLYTGLWMRAIWLDTQPEVELGFENVYLASERVQVVHSVHKQSPAEHAGLLAGDRIVAVDGVPIADESFVTKIWMRHHPGDAIHLTIQRPGTGAPLELTGVFRRRASSSAGDILGRQLNIWFPCPFVIVGLTVLFLRPEDLNAWLLALLFGGVVASRGMPPPLEPPGWWPVALAYQGIFIAMLGPAFYWFYARFPTGAIDRRFPWMKWILGCLGIVFVLGAIREGRIQLPPPLASWAGEVASVRIGTTFLIFCLVLGLLAFAANFFSTRDKEARRKLRLIFWTTVVGIGPNLVRVLLETYTGWRAPEWLNNTLQALLTLTPLTFAYAVLVHRVLEIPVLLKRSARYLLVQRGFTLLLSLVSIGLTLLFAVSFPRYLRSAMVISQPLEVGLGAVFGTALLWSGTQVHKRVSDRIDRAFFRKAYDARVILEDLAEKTRTATDRAELEDLLRLYLVEALQPSFLSVRLEHSAAAQEQAECVVPILGRDGHELGSLVLGPRLSEEPYSGEDKRLLASVASQTATALENIRLAEEIAGRIERERRAEREMEIAREVQTRLLPQAPPPLKTLDCAARCIQARAVGGDYYDFLDLGPNRAGLVLADVSGKGVHAALLVAHLQACLRTQSLIAPLAPLEMLRQVNQMLYRSTAAQHFATLFYAIYDDSAQELLYVNCGHNAPVWLRRDGSITRLDATATVIGAFAHWEGSACRARLAPGDLLVLFSDGVTEAACDDDEFGEARLVAQLQTFNGSSVDVIVAGILSKVQDFSRGEQSDDLTLLVARAK